ncbi:MAG: hypothetical protein H5T69_21360, partial [Chloroflexi bacterium]|nr:hypothetical protein [Chloroflexota bacterium]
ASAPYAGRRFSCRFALGELYRIGEDLSADNGWALAWNTRTVIDGDYDLLVEVKDAEEHTTWLRCPVRVRNDAPMLEEGSLKLPDRVSDVQKIAWATRTSAGGPMTATLEYSPDLGVHWLPIAQDLAADGEFVWDTRAAPDSFAGLLRLTLGNRGHVLQFLSNPFTLNNVNDPPFIALLAPGA